MKSTQAKALKQLAGIATEFSKEAEVSKLMLLKEMADGNFNTDKKLTGYSELLLFMLAYPGSAALVTQLQKNISALKKKMLSKGFFRATQLQNTGLPHTTILTTFSHDILGWMSGLRGIHLAIDSYKRESLPDLLKVTLPSLERELVNYGYETEDLLQALQVEEENILPFILNQLSVFNDKPILKDHLFEALSMYVEVRDDKGDFTKFNNRFLIRDIFYHGDILKKFDHVELLQRTLPEPVLLDCNEKSELMKVVRMSLVLTARETDPSTFMDVNSLRFYQLERGISVALYGMTPGRQLPLESYVGYTLFKNGLPCAYGGSWVFGRRALFGMNIFEPYRGGESGYIMCQLLRVYKLVFNISVFEVEPYQFGKDNPDGIKSGAFWFYYKYGFRPDDKKLRLLAENEKKKISSRKGYYSSPATLTKFTDSFLILETETLKQPRVAEMSERVTTHIRRKFKGDRKRAIEQAVNKLRSVSQTRDLPDGPALIEWALVAAAYNTYSDYQLDLLSRLINAKAENLYEYQDVLLNWFR